MGEERAHKLFRGIVAANGISVRKGHTLLATLAASGEVPLALTVYNYKPPQLKAKGAAIDWIVLQPAIAQLHAIAVHAKPWQMHAAPGSPATTLARPRQDWWLRVRRLRAVTSRRRALSPVAAAW